MGEIDESYGKNIQNDSQMFGVHLISQLISSMKNELNESEDNISDDDEEELNNVDKNISTVEFKRSQKNKNNKFCKNLNNEITFLEKMFRFDELSIKINNTNDYYRKVSEIFLNINLFFPNNNKTCSLEDLLKIRYSCNKHLNNEINNKNIFKVIEQLSNKVKKIYTQVANFIDNKKENHLIKGKGTEEPIKIVKLYEINAIASLPKILIISLNRAIIGKSFHINKLQYEEHLDLSNYIDDNLCQKQCFKYDLYAVNECKAFSKSYGHYYSFVKINDIWYKFDDENFEKENPNFNSEFVVGLYYISSDKNTEK